MPTYEFFCTKCKKTKDEFHTMQKVPRHIKCPRCGRLMKRQLGSGQGFMFTDWYSKDKSGRLKITKNND